MTRLAAVVAATAACAGACGLAACGGSSSSGAVGAAQRFIDGVSNGDGHVYCPYIGWTTTGAPLPPPALAICERSDYFLITGSCDREAAVSGSSIAGSEVSGASATVKLSSGGQLQLEHRQRWLVANIVPGPHPAKLTHGGCAGA